MKPSLAKNIQSFWKTLITIGIYDSGDVAEQKRIKIIDSVSFICLPVIFVFASLSVLTGHRYLAYFYAVISLLIILLIYGNYKKKGESFRILIIFLVCISCAVANVLFDNGQGYYVLLITFLSVLFYGMRKGILYLSLFYAALYLASEIGKLYINPIEPVVNYIKVIRAINVLITLSVLVYFLYDSKKTYLRTLDEAIIKKKNLEEYNALLIQQAITLEMKNKDIEELKNKNEELSSIVYHQLRSPVVTFSDMLAQYIDHGYYSKEEFLEISKHIQQKVTDTLNIIDNLLMWNRKGVDGIQPKPLVCDLKDLIDKAIIQIGPLLEKKAMEIKYPDCDSMMAYADPDHILIILLNILTNAVKFSPPCEKIDIEFFELNNRCRLHISNNGRGIEREHLQTIFSTLRIISVKGTMNETGTGLGLKICKNLVEKNNGSIDIRSEANEITTIIIELPTAA